MHEHIAWGATCTPFPRHKNYGQKIFQKNFKKSNFNFCGGTLTTNCRPLVVSVVCPLGAVNQQFYVGPDRFVVRDVFLSVFDGSIVTISMDRSTRFCLDVSASLGLVQYRCVLHHTLILKKA